LFGHLIVHWGPKTCTWFLDGTRRSSPYQLIGRDDSSVVVKMICPITKKERLLQIHFSKDHYFQVIGGGFVEFFRRLEKTDRRLPAKKLNPKLA